jgi:hypothetical protein
MTFLLHWVRGLVATPSRVADKLLPQQLSRQLGQQRR